MNTDISEVITRLGTSLKEGDCPDPQMFKIFGPGETRTAFKNIGLISLNNLIRYAGLAQHETVLDIGCGIGRVALPLTHYLDSSARYYGIDPVKEAISWCRDNISSKRTNFSFEHVDWYNKMYNKRGTVDPASYKFSWENGSFDLVYLFSVFTHIKPDTLRNYLSEIKRMLTKNGRVFMTMFIVDEDTERRIDNNETHRPFFKADENYWTDHRDIHESAMAYRYAYVQDLLKDLGLQMSGSYIPGGWREKKAGQDILVAWNR